ncbi:MAG: insulinase family protein [Planctomycetaceae bacterium]|nr:insulinase family protein [Planctomycetaceae bacterium]
MSAEVNDVTHGFELLSVETVTELNSTALKFKHVQSGASLLYLSNDDDNKVFAITFRTPPTDDSGVAHIMEHSVLCGSEKFRTKEPFMNLRKTSLQTFLNAYTADDCTAYPVASRNEKDLQNLMNVYLDAVFFPQAVHVPEILMQEGWHYQVDSKTGELKYNGIVYNEMKGAYSSPQTMLYRAIRKTMYPDSTYANDSGGYPDAIPTLTMENFRKFHEKYYHPSNAMIFLYGNGDVEKHLKFLDDEYLCNFNKKEIDIEIQLQPMFNVPKDVVTEYSVNPEDSTASGTFLSVNYLLDADVENVERYLGMDMLAYLLVESEASPLKRALLDAGIGKEINASFDGSIKQPCFSIIVNNSEPENKELFQKIVNETLHNLVKNGIDSKLIEGAINRKEFQLREYMGGHFAKGVMINMQMHKTWVYNADPLLHQRYEPVVKNIRDKVQNQYFEKLIQTYLLDNLSYGLVTVVPKQGLEKANADKINAKLMEIRKSLPEPELDEIREKQQVLIARQSAPDDPKEVAKIPRLDLTDVKRKAEEIPFTKKNIGDTKVFNVHDDTNQIAYVSVHFDAMQLPDTAIPYVSLLSEILGRLDTANFTYADLNSEIDIHTGGFSTSVTTFPLKNKKNEFAATFVVNTKVMLPQLKKGLELTLEIINNTKFDNIERIEEIVREQRVALEQSLTGRSGYRIAQTRALSYFSGINAYWDKVSGVGYYHFLVELEKKLDAGDGEQIAVALKNCAEKLFNKSHQCTITATLPNDDFVSSEPIFARFESQLPIKTDNAVSITTFPVNKQLNEAIVTPGRVQCVVKAADYQMAGFEYSGKMLVLNDILRTGYIWDNIRILGGAYGGGFTADRSGYCSFWSYRDPRLKETLNVFDKTADYLKNLELSDMELTDAVIATIGGIDRPLTPPQKAARVTAMYYSGLTNEDYQQEWDEVLSTTLDDIRNFSTMFENMLKQNNICVIGNREKIETDKELFKNTIRIP